MQLSAIYILIGVLFCAHIALCVDKKKFKTCVKSSFCTRLRNRASSNHVLDKNSIIINSDSVEGKLADEQGSLFSFHIVSLSNSTFRFQIREIDPVVKRFEVPHVLVNEPELSSISVTVDDESMLIQSAGRDDYAVVTFQPFVMKFFKSDSLALTVNGQNSLIFERTRVTPSDSESNEESFDGHKDVRPHGDQAVGLDFTFADMDNVYGIPEHADTFRLGDTSDTDPYRLYNLDVFEYETMSKMALYASIPVMYGHRTNQTVGLLWLNSAETWVDVKYQPEKGLVGEMLDTLSNFVVNESDSGPNQKSAVANWMSETGIIDVFIMLGPSPIEVFNQLTALLGPTPLPPESTLGYHQCRWNYNDESDVLRVVEKFDEHHIPLDTMWLDIDHTDGRRYFTWDSRKFPHPLTMIDRLASTGRKLVTIVDPHMKMDEHFRVATELRDQNLLVKMQDGEANFDGWCWPGSSYYPDFLNEAAVKYFAEQYSFDKYQGTNLNVFIWNDMNEPSVFSGPEVTMPKHLVHHGQVEHRAVHNLYAHLYTTASHLGQLMRSDSNQRPFVLTRGAFAGTHRTSAIWTGDNAADWTHLRLSVPMCLSMAIAGMHFCGADIGGFFGNPSPQLLLRWYQTAAFQPFFRAHAHIDTKRREPYLFRDYHLMRDAISLRYSYLPQIYTLFFEAESKNAGPPMRPVWFEFPDVALAFTFEDEHLLGSSLLVRPVSQENLEQVDILFPPGLWYDIHTWQIVFGDVDGKVIPVPTRKDYIPVYQRGGTIVPKKERIRRASTLMRHDPYTLIVCLDVRGEASGTLYMDDGLSYNYTENGHQPIVTVGSRIQSSGDRQRNYLRFTYSSGQLSTEHLEAPNYHTRSWLERVVIVGLSDPKKITHAQLSSGGRLEVSVAHSPASYAAYEHDQGQFSDAAEALIIRRPGVNMATEWTIALHSL